MTGERLKRAGRNPFWYDMIKQEVHYAERPQSDEDTEFVLALRRNMDRGRVIAFEERPEAPGHPQDANWSVPNMLLWPRQRTGQHPQRSHCHESISKGSPGSQGAWSTQVPIDLVKAFETSTSKGKPGLSHIAKRHLADELEKWSLHNGESSVPHTLAFTKKGLMELGKAGIRAEWQPSIAVQPWGKLLPEQTSQKSIAWGSLVNMTLKRAHMEGEDPPPETFWGTREAETLNGAGCFSSLLADLQESRLTPRPTVFLLGLQGKKRDALLTDKMATLFGGVAGDTLETLELELLHTKLVQAPMHTHPPWKGQKKGPREYLVIIGGTQ